MTLLPQLALGVMGGVQIKNFTMTVMTTKVPTFLSESVKDEIVNRLYSLVEAEVRDYLNVAFLRDEMTKEEYDQLEYDTLQYLEDNLSIYIK